MTATGPDRTSMLKRAVERSPKRSAVLTVVFLVTALSSAIGAAALLTRYVDARATRSSVAMTRVVVAAGDVPSGTALRAEALRTIEWPTAALPEGTSSDPAALAGRVVTSPLAKGEPVLTTRLAPPGASSGLSAVLPAGMRAVAVRVDDVVGVAGFVHPGDSVDVIVTMKPAEGSTAPPVSKIVLQRVRVLAVGKQVERSEHSERTTPATVATLMVDSADSERLALAAAKGQLLLSLRSMDDEDVVATGGITPPALLSAAVQAPPPARRAAPSRSAPPKLAQAAPPPPAAPQGRVVEILRGDLFEQRKFDGGGK